MINNFLFRIIITVVIFMIFKIKNVKSLPLLVIVLIITDSLDCGLYPGTMCKDIGSTELYQKTDKVVDLLIYVFFIILFRDLFDPFTLKILFAFIAYRAVGVARFYVSGNTSFLKYFPDFINSTLIAYTIYKQFNLTRRTYYIMIIIGMVFKILFEIHHHNKVLH